MKTQQISAQNFGGTIVYVTKNGEKHVNDIQNRLPDIYRELKKPVHDLLNKESFDVFISRGKSPLEFSVKASDGKHSTDVQVVKLIPKKRELDRTSYYENSDNFASAIFSSIANFKKGIFKI